MIIDNLRRRRGFTLVELLVVISIIGLLMAMLLPAVQSAIRAADKATCTNNQREVALALIQAEQRKGRFPGYSNRIFEAAPPIVGSWVVPILPDMGRTDVYDTWVTPVSNGPPQPQMPYLAQLVCPSDEQPSLAGPWLSYVVNCGVPDTEPIATIGHQGATVPTDFQATGIFHNHAPLVPNNRTIVSLAYIQNNDGTSTTLLLTENIQAHDWTAWVTNMSGNIAPQVIEARVGFVWEGTRGYFNPSTNVYYNHNQSASVPVAPFNRVQKIGSTTGGEVYQPTEPTRGYVEARPASSHEGGVVAAFADGHVQFLSEKIHDSVYRLICTPNGRGTQNLALPMGDPRTPANLRDPTYDNPPVILSEADLNPG